MKIQDAGFVVIAIILLCLRKTHLFIYVGLLGLLIAIPLFYKWIFFTADRLVWYSVAFLCMAMILLFFQGRRTA